MTSSSQRNKKPSKKPTPKKAAKAPTKKVAKTVRKSGSKPISQSILTRRPQCVVVGSSFLDYVGYCDRVPNAGETVHSSSFQKGFGGKGANQAYMVALLKKNFDVKMVTAVGKDGDGEAYINNLKSVGIDTQFVQQIEGESTGLAMISVSTVTGQNQIVICPNATNQFNSTKIKWEEIFGGKKSEAFPHNALVVQNEIPIATTLRALEEAASRNMLTVLNPAPAPNPKELQKIRPFLKYVDIFCPNETEAALIAGVTAVTEANAKSTCEKLLSLGVGAVVLTMGSNGYSIMTNDGTFSHHKAFKGAKVVDTTGAGDCFVGTMVSNLIPHLGQQGLKGNQKFSRESLVNACDAANGAAFLSVQKKGTQTSFPNADTIKKLAPSDIKK